jgi:hypothetical protein
LLNILAALTYNLISDLVGGIRFDVVDTDREAPASPEGPSRRPR